MFHLDQLPNQRPHEKTVLFLRRHWTTPLKIIIGFILAALVPQIVLTFFRFFSPETISGFGANAILTVMLSIYYLGAVTVFFQSFIDYYLDTWIVTTERIINIEQQGLFNRTASEMHLAAVQDVAAEVKGTLHTFLDYGDVFIQSAGEIRRFQFKGIPAPERVRQAILRLVHIDQRRHGRKKHPHQRPTVG